MGLLTVFGLATILLGSLKPSQEAVGLQSQFRFPLALLDDLEPGEIRVEPAGFPVFVVVPDQRIDEEIRRATALSRDSEIKTFNEDYGAYILWGLSPKSRGVHCGLRAVERDESYEWDGVVVPGGFFDLCTGDRFDYAGRILIDANGRGVRNLRRPEFERVSGDQLQITNTDYLFSGIDD